MKLLIILRKAAVRIWHERRFWCYMSLYLVFLVGLELLLFHGVIPVPDSKLALVSNRYDRIVSKQPFGPEVDRTTIVELTPSADSDQLDVNRCHFRGYLLRVLQRLDVLNPEGVAIDVEMPANVPCPAEDAMLARQLKLQCSKYPIVFGQTRDRRRSLSRIVPYLPDSQSPTEGKDWRSGNACLTGLLELPPDSRQGSLFWSTGEGPRATFDWTFARALKPSLSRDPTLKPQLDEDDPLYAEVLTRDAWVRAGRVLTSETLLQSSDDQVRHLVEHKQLILGSTEEEGHQTYQGSVPGHVLHASAVEAILHRWLWARLSNWIQLPAVALLLLLIESYHFRAKEPHSLTHGAIMCSLWLAAYALAYCADRMLAAVWARYADFAMLSIMAFVFWLVPWAHGVVHHQIRHRRRSPNA